MSTRSTSKPWRASCTAWCDDHPDAPRELEVLGQEGHAHEAGYRSPVPLRVAFLGPAATFGAHALHAPADGVEPLFVDRAARRARRVDADVVIALAPARVPDDRRARRWP